MNQLESTFEKSVIKKLKADGYFAAHLGGPDGWPDIIAMRGSQCNLFELKSIRATDWQNIRLVNMFEPSQSAFVIKYPMLCVTGLIKTVDGIFYFNFTHGIARNIPAGIQFSDIDMKPWTP